MNIVLIGFMGSGKTSVGKIVAKELGKRFVDMDDMIEAKTAMTINDIFARFGEDYFRDIESEVASELAQEDGLVIACGGGVVLREENINKLKRNGIICYLDVSPEVAYVRLQNDDSRPLLKVDNPLETIKELLSMRKAKYLNAADIVIKTDQKSPEEIAEELLKRVDCSKL